MSDKYYGGDANIPEGIRGPLYADWTEFRDYMEANHPNDLWPQIDDFRVGFVRGWLAARQMQGMSYLEYLQKYFPESAERELRK